jgi:hypothetical protein
MIEGEDYKIIPCGTGPFFDLELLYTVNPRGGVSRTEFKNAAYGITFESALKRIINYRIFKRKETLTLKEYLKEYKRYIDELKSITEVK